MGSDFFGTTCQFSEKKSGRNEADVPGTTLSKTMQNQLFSSNLTNSSSPKIHHQPLRTKTEFPPTGRKAK